MRMESVDITAQKYLKKIKFTVPNCITEMFG